MSAEMVTVVLPRCLVALGGMGFVGLSWVIRRIDDRLDRFSDSVDQRFARVDERCDRLISDMDARFEKVGERLGGVQGELTEVKIAVARLEGPCPRLVLPH